MIRRILVALLLVSSAGACTTTPTRAKPDETNIVFILTDDLAMNLVPYMPNVQALAKVGTTFSNYTVTDSLCCPSRTSIFTGNFPHDTGVFTNGGDDGGWGTFQKRGDGEATFATDLQQAGYRTAMMGKFLNGWLPKDKIVPPGWDEWDVAGNGYPEYDYNLLENDQIKHYGKSPADYLTDVVSAKAQNFVTKSIKDRKPFLVEVATFAPHAPYTPAEPDTDKFTDVKAPRTQAYDTLPSDAPAWIAARAPLTDKEKSSIDNDFRKRVQAVQSVDRMIGALRDTLTTAGVADRTLVVFSSDNGYHMGEHRLNPGKQTAFDTDVHVPLVMAGPGVRKDATVAEAAENIDLRPTFADVAGAAAPAVDGRSLRPLLAGNTPDGWRTAALIEHHGPDGDPSDPDYPARNSGNPPTYSAIRTADYTYVEYADGGKEYYDHNADPDQLHNAAKQLPADQAARMHHTLTELVGCHQAC